MKQTNKTEFVRVEKTKNYTVIHNQFLKRKDLSWKAKGILAYVLSLPDDWNINLNELMKHATDGEASFRTGWKELSDKGYVKRKPVRDKQRIKYWETVIYENVDVEQSPLLVDFQDVENLHVDNQDVDNRNLLSTKELSTNKQSTKEHSSAKLTEDFEKLWNLFPNKLGKKKAKSSYDRAIKSGTTNKEIQDGIVSYKKHLKQNDWLKPAHGATWFNNERWEDEYGVGNGGSSNKSNWESYLE